jgi:hypothetical protein
MTGSRCCAVLNEISENLSGGVCKKHCRFFMEKKMQVNRHQEALETTQQLVESIAQLTRFFPRHEDMVMVPMMRDAVMTIQKSVMMLAIGQLNAGDSDHHCAEGLGKIEVLRTYLQISFDLEYIGSDDFNRLTRLLEIVRQKLSLPKKPKLEIVK